MVIKLKYPIAYDIKAYETENGNWILQYVEEFPPGYSEMIKDTVKDVKPLLPDADFEIWGDRIIINLEASRDKVLNVLAGEFLGVSPLGKMQLNELLVTLCLKMRGGNDGN